MAAQVFVFENVKDKDERHKLLQSALRDYSGIDSAEIIYKSKGKPTIKGTAKELFVSVATVNEVMVCVFSEKPVGIAGEYLQRYKDESSNADYLSMAEKFFTSEESDYCRDNDAISFVNIWTRKIAYCKYSGINNRDFHSFSVTDGDKLFAKVKGVSLKKFSPQFPGSSEYLFIIAGDIDI